MTRADALRAALESLRNGPDTLTPNGLRIVNEALLADSLFTSPAIDHPLVHLWGKPNPSDEPHRWCIYCKADCELDEPEHHDECPSVTGRFPVRYPGDTEGRHDPHRCTRCEALFAVDGFYHQIKVVEGGDNGTMFDAPVYEVVCEDCALAALTSGEEPRETL